MSVETTLDAALGLVIVKSRSGLTNSTTPGTGGNSGGGTGSTLPPRPASINFQWTGGGSAIQLVACDPIVVDVPFPCRLAYAHMRAGDGVGNPAVAVALVEVMLSQFETFGSRTLLSAGGAIPSLAGSKADLSMTGWKRDLTTGDTLIARLTSFVGTATWLSLTLLLLPTDVAQTVSPVVDSNGNLLIDSDGNTMILKGPS